MDFLTCSQTVRCQKGSISEYKGFEVLESFFWYDLVIIKKHVVEEKTYMAPLLVAIDHIYLH